MPTLMVTTRNGDDLALDGQIGLSLMEVIRGCGVDDLVALCAGGCSCATCHVYIDEAYRDRLPAMSDDENDLLDCSSHRQVASRLSCQIPVTEALEGIRVTIAPED